MRIRTILSCVAIVLGTAGCNGGGSQASKASAAGAGHGLSSGDMGECSLVMGWDPWEPYLYADLDGTVRGLDVELISAFAKRAGCDMRFEKASWTDLLERLRGGEIDVVAGASITASRRNFAWFSNPYRRESFALYVREGEATKYPSTVLYDLLLMDMKIGVVTAYVYGDEITALQESERFSSQFVEVPISELNYVRLLDLQIDGFLEDPFVAATILRHKGLEDDVEQHPLVVDSGAVHFMFSKQSVDEQVVTRINEAMSALIADGSYQAILDKYRL